jgi:hypothetical protein
MAKLVRKGLTYEGASVHQYPNSGDYKVTLADGSSFIVAKADFEDNYVWEEAFVLQIPAPTAKHVVVDLNEAQAEPAPKRGRWLK